MQQEPKAGFDGLRYMEHTDTCQHNFCLAIQIKEQMNLADLVNRARFSTEIIKNIKQKCGDDFL